MDSFIGNVRVGLRGLRRTPGFTVMAMLTLALGIGLSTAVFTVADALLLRRLPVRDQDRLVVLWGEKTDHTFDNFPLHLADSREFARRTRSLGQVAFFSRHGATPIPVRVGDQVSRFRGAVVSGGFFDVLGAQPELGRVIRAEDDAPGAEPVVVLSHAAWKRNFGGDTRILGRQLQTYENGVTYTIVGVMPQGLDYPGGTDIWLPVAQSMPAGKEQYVELDVIGRLAPGAAPADARDELTNYFGRPDAPAPLRKVHGVVHTLPQLVLGDAKPALFAFAAAAGLLLLITCINVANLLLVRGLARIPEIAVRSALGASRARVVVQLLTENAILAIGGGVVGVAVAANAVQLFIAFAPADTPRLDEIGLNTTALAGALGITCVAMLFFALAPAIVTSRVELQRVLRAGGRQSVNRRSRLAAELLVAGQVALSLVVLAAAGVVAKSLVNLERAKLSLEPSGLLVGELALRYDPTETPAGQRALLKTLLPVVQGIPGIRDVSPVVAVPFSMGWDGAPMAQGQTPQESAANPYISIDLAVPDYFATFGIPLLRGRAFTDADRTGAPQVAILSELAARHYWPNGDPVGKHLLFGSASPDTVTVVGIVPETRYRNLREPRPGIYFPLDQSVFPFVPTALAIRTTRAPAELVPVLRRAIAEATPGVTLVSMAPFATYLDRPLAQPRLNALLLAVFAGAAVILAAVGLFGAMASMVRQRTRDLGIRMALGATAGDLRRMVLIRGLAIAAGGAAVGLAGALLANRLLAAMLYQTSATDGLTLAAVTGFLVAIAALASFIPAQATTRIDPLIALRSD